MDEQLFLTIFSHTQHSLLLVMVANFLAVYGIWILYAVVLCALILPEKVFFQGTRAATTALIAVVVALLTKEIFVHIFPTPRPFVLLDIHPSIIIAPYEPYRSFPSGHALSSFAIAMSLFLYNKRLGSLLLLLALCIGCARVAAGVHWPNDVLVGSLLGIAIGAVVYRLREKRIQ